MSSASRMGSLDNRLPLSSGSSTEVVIATCMGCQACTLMRQSHQLLREAASVASSDTVGWNDGCGGHAPVARPLPRSITDCLLPKTVRTHHRLSDMGHDELVPLRAGLRRLVPPQPDPPLLVRRNHQSRGLQGDRELRHQRSSDQTVPAPRPPPLYHHGP